MAPQEVEVGGRGGEWCGGGGRREGATLPDTVTTRLIIKYIIKYKMGDAVTCFDCSVSDFVPAEGNVTVDSVCYC